MRELATISSRARRSATYLVASGAAVILAGCATQPPPGAGDAPGFFAGVLHGLIALPTLLASLLLEVRVYAFPNSGFWYDLGFCGGFGLGIAFLALPIIPLVGGFLTRRN